MERLEPGDPRQVGGYRLEGRLGTGGMGRVFLGFSGGGRAVAVKVIHPELARDCAFRGRFGREVAAAQLVSGAYTAPVVAAGPDDDPPWLATTLVPGPSLAEAVAGSGPLPEAALWKLMAGLVEALQAIHSCGLVHRDLKPSNVLLATDGPRVIDFGIVRAIDGTHQTATGMIVGTPAFMSPEQAEGTPTGTASDVFSLGSTIAFAATGAPPFGDGDPAPVLYRIVHGRPRLDGVPGRLRDLVAGCLAKLPADRPALEHLAGAIAATSASPAATMSASFWPDAVTMAIRSHERAHGNGRVPHPPTAPAGPPGRSIPPTRTYARRRPSAPVPREQRRTPPAPFKRRGWRWSRVIPVAAAAVCLAVLLTPLRDLVFGGGPGPEAVLQGFASPPGAIEFSADGRILTAGAGDGTVTHWNVSTGHRVGAVVHTITDQLAGAEMMALSPDQRTLALGRTDGTVTLWDLSDHRQTATLETGLDVVTPADGLAFSPDSQVLAISISNTPVVDAATTTLWSVAGHRQFAALSPQEGFNGGSPGLAFSPGGTALVTVGWHSVRLLNVATGRLEATLGQNNDAGTSVAFSPDGLLVAVANRSTVRMWNTITHELVATLSNPGDINSSSATPVAFSPDGRLVAASSGFTVRIWKVASRQLVATVQGDGDVSIISFSPDHHTLATATTGPGVLTDQPPPCVEIWNLNSIL
jgi:WD40 repeat protein